MPVVSRGDKFVFAQVIKDVVDFLELPDDTAPDLSPDELKQRYDRILETVEILLDRPPDEQPIIVISGDEGPMLCGHVDCIDGSAETYGIRFGTLRAYYLPDIDYQVPSDDSGLNIFRTVFREYFGADLPPLPNRSFDWPDEV